MVVAKGVSGLVGAMDMESERAARGWGMGVGETADALGGEEDVGEDLLRDCVEDCRLVHIDCRGTRKRDNKISHYVR